jgi:GNAT superfamily N-acetyltransferase
MPARPEARLRLKTKPLTLDRWSDLEKLFGPRGACGGCWCMWWRQTRSDFDRNKGAANKWAFWKLVRGGEVPGLLGYAKGEPVAWCSVGPRESFASLERSRVLKRVDDQPVWSIVCLFVAKTARRRGVSTAMLRAAAEYAHRRGARIVEGYPVEPKKEAMPDAFAWTGLASAYRQAGFVEVLRRSPTRPIMRHQKSVRKQ